MTGSDEKEIKKYVDESVRAVEKKVDDLVESVEGLKKGINRVSEEFNNGRFAQNVANKVIAILRDISSGQLETQVTEAAVKKAKMETWKAVILWLLSATGTGGLFYLIAQRLINR